MACLRLHEDSAHRLRDSLVAERDKVAHDLSRQVSKVKGDLAAVQEQYVLVCEEKEKMEGRREEERRKMEDMLGQVREGERGREGGRERMREGGGRREGGREGGRGREGRRR